MAEENIYAKQLRKTGIVDAYEYLLRMLCKYGLPKDNIYDFAAVQMMQFEKNGKQRHLKKLMNALKREKSLRKRKGSKG